VAKTTTREIPNSVAAIGVAFYRFVCFPVAVMDSVLVYSLSPFQFVSGVVLVITSFVVLAPSHSLSLNSRQ
jgi:hypothetical protein